MKLRLIVCLLPCLALGITLQAQSPVASVYKDPKAPVEKRVEDLLGQLTVEEKIGFMAGTGYMNLYKVNRLDIPSFKLSDGPMGARVGGPATAYANGVGLAATWDKEFAQRAGVAMGRDCRARGDSVILAPAMNLYRAPICGRNFEYLGEDPQLAGQIAASFIIGCQSQGVGVTAKHFAGNEQEPKRHSLDSQIEERTLRELYLKPFQICVRNGALGIMTSYNPLNGIHASQNDWLMNKVLKGDWGFQGLVMSDWGSCYDTLGMANGGLDIEMPNGKFFNKNRLTPLLASNQITQATIDDKVRRFLRVAFTLGWFDRPQLDSSIPKDDPTSDAVATDGAREAITLLKNKNNLLPVDPTKVKSVVLLGFNADPAVTGAGGSSYTQPFHSVSVLKGVQALLGSSAEVTRVPWAPAGSKGALDGYGAKGGPSIPEEFNDKVKGADLAVVCIGFNAVPGYRYDKNLRDYEGEGNDRSYTLLPGQVELIKATLALNPKTVVILNAGGSVATEGWIDDVPAFLHAYYPGQNGGTAIAEILFGKTNPSGKLPFSWEKRWEDCAAFGNYPLQENNFAANTYKEGVFLGYRWFDAKKIEPRFPFGFGLSYTTFEYSDLKIGAPDDKGNITATATIKNTGKVAGAEVAELYVEPPKATVERPVRELKGFTRVMLQPGESKTVTIPFLRDDLAYWDPEAKKWTLTPGSYSVKVGGSSRDLPLKADLKL